MKTSLCRVIMIAVVLSPVPATSGSESESQLSPAGQTRITRADLEADVAGLEARFNRGPDDPEARLEYAALLFRLGDFARARELVTPLADDPEALPEVLELASRSAYVLGSYDEAERLYLRLIDVADGDEQVLANAWEGLLRTYYQTNRFDRIREALSLPESTVYRLASAFETNPYETQWEGQEKESVVPLLMTDPLPLLTIEVNRVPIIVFIDTGADMLTLDPEIADALGIEPLASRQGRFAGGQQAEVSYARADSVSLGTVTLRGVPIAALPTKRFSSGFDGGKVIVGGILGTSILRQFLSTIDYEDGRLILRDRDPETARALRQGLAAQQSTEIAFVLDRYHLMLARGVLDSAQGLTFFVDSGLNSAACLVAPIQTLHLTGIPVPELDQAGTGGGEAKVQFGSFPIARIGLGTLIRTDLIGDYGPMPPQLYEAFGYVLDGMISHQYLRQSATWTIDFDAMRYYFTE